MGTEGGHIIMTVRELIEELESVYDKDLEVVMSDTDGEYYDVLQTDITMLASGKEVCVLG